MRALKAVADHFTSVPSVTKAGGMEKAMLVASPSFWAGVAKELFTKDGDQGSAVTAKIPIRAGSRRSRSAGPSAFEAAQKRHASKIERMGLVDREVTPRNTTRLGRGD